MQLNNEFTVEAGVDETWALLTDLERIAPCMPGATLTGRDGDDYLGNVKIKVGPIGANFGGTARFLEKDDAAHTAVITMAGKDAKGAATANATIRARLEDLGGATRVYVDTDLDITGRMAQFGRGAIADVSNRLLGQFTDNLSREIAGGGQAAPAAATGATGAAQPAAGATAGAAGAAPRPAAAAASNDLNVMDLLGPGLVNQIGKPLLFFVLGYLVARAFPRKGQG